MNKEPRLAFYESWEYEDGYQFAYIAYSDFKRMVAEPLTLKEIPAGHAIEQPTFRLSSDAMTQLMNDMWIAGIRPSEKIIEPMNRDHYNGEINWLRGVADHLMKRTPK